jgi:hypothetical protein
VVGPILLQFVACTAGIASPADKDESPTWSDTSSPDSAETGDSHPEADSADSADDTGNAPPPDLDCDGHVDIAAGGDDCDDRNDTVYPGAEEGCDPMDHNCEVQILEAGVCGKVQSGAVMIPFYQTETVGAPTLVDDVTGDGRPDLLAEREAARRAMRKRGVVPRASPVRMAAKPSFSR